MPKKYITVRVEIDYEVEEDYDTTEFKYAEIIESVYPVAIHTNDTPPEVLRAAIDYLQHDDDADFEFMWELRGLLEKKEKTL